MSNGQEAEDLRNFAGILRPGDSGALDEGRFGSLGRGQQSLSPGAARQSEDPDVVAATMAKPGVMLKRPVGSNGPFKEHAELPTNLGHATARPSKAAREPAGQKTSSRPADKAAELKAAVAYEREQKRRVRERAREEAARPNGREHRQQAVDKAQSSLDKAEREHAERAGAIQAEADAIEKSAPAENARWKKEKEQLGCGAAARAWLEFQVLTLPLKAVLRSGHIRSESAPSHRAARGGAP